MKVGIAPHTILRYSLLTRLAPAVLQMVYRWYKAPRAPVPCLPCVNWCARGPPHSHCPAVSTDVSPSNGILTTDQHINVNARATVPPSFPFRIAIPRPKPHLRLSRPASSSIFRPSTSAPRIPTSRYDHDGYLLLVTEEKQYRAEQSRETGSRKATGFYGSEPSIAMDHHLAGFQIPAMAQPPLMNQPPQIFGANAYDTMQMQHMSPELTAQMFGDPSMLLDDTSDAKRRRIARVSPASSSSTHTPTHHHKHCGRPMGTGVRLTPPAATGLRYVQEKEDQVRREAASMHALHQLQDGMRLHSGREEEESAQRVSALVILYSTTGGSLCTLSIWDHQAHDFVTEPSISKALRTVSDAWRACCDCRVRLPSYSPRRSPIIPVYYETRTDHAK